MPQDEQPKEVETLILLLRHFKGATKALESYLEFIKEKSNGTETRPERV